MSEIVAKSRSEYLLKTRIQGDERIVINATQFITPAIIASYIGQQRGLDNYLPITGGTITGNLRLKGEGSYGNKINFGDGEHVYLHENSDDHLLISASKGIDLATGTSYNVKVNGAAVITTNSNLEDLISDNDLEQKMLDMGFSKGGSSVDYLPITGGTLTGDLRLKNNTNFGLKINFGDGELVYLYEDTDDHLLIHAQGGVHITTGTQGAVVKINGTEVITAGNLDTNVSNLGYIKSGSFLPISGGTITGNLRLKGSENYGNKLNFGDGEYVYLYENTDDHLLIHGDRGITISTTQGEKVDINGYSIVTDENLEKKVLDLGFSKSGGGGGITLADVWSTLTNNSGTYANTKINNAHIDFSGYVASTAITTIWKGTQSQYNAISNKLVTTLYLITA